MAVLIRSFADKVQKQKRCRNDHECVSLGQSALTVNFRCVHLARHKPEKDARMSRNTIIGGVVIAAIAVAIYWGMLRPQNEMTAEVEAGPMVEVTVPELTGAAKMGEQFFNAKCAVCHGENAAGKEGFGPPLIHKIYEPSHHGDMAFMLAPRRGVQAHHWRFGDMPPVEGLTDGDIKQLIAYVRTVQRANGIN